MMGNIRVTFSDDNSDGIPETKSINDYYSFGMEWNNRWELSDTISSVNKYRYNGKEFVEEMGWKNLDYGLRNMDPLLGRMMQVDPLSDKYPGMSPFQYAGNNPISFIDMKGDSISPFARAIVGDDNQGHITSATTEHRENAPISAGLKDASFFILSSLGLNALDNLIFGSEPLEERVVNAANEIVTPVPSKMPKVKGPLNAANKADYVVTPDGVTVPLDQKAMRQGFDKAGYPSKTAVQTREKGIIHTVKTKNGSVDVRTMEGSNS
jgi:RHS repeat-associated protein